MKKSVLFIVLSLLFMSCQPINAPDSTATLPPTHSTLPVTNTTTTEPTFTSVIKLKTPVVTIESMDAACPPTQVSNMPLGINYIGLQVPPYPNGIETSDGILIEVLNGKEFAITHAITGQQHLFWLEELICRSQGKAYFQVVDSVVLPQMADNEFVVLATCSLSGSYETIDSQIAAIGYLPDKNNWQISATKAWRANIENGLFEELPAKQVICFKDRADE